MTKSTSHLVPRILTAAIALGIGLLVTAPAAAAATAAVAPTPADISAAHQAAATPAVVRSLDGFFAHRGAPASRANATAESATEARMAAKVVGPTVPVYYLNPAFVSAQSASVPVATVVFLATEAVASTGLHASVWTVRQGDSWHEFNIASGSDETDYAASAARYGIGAIAFYEPQIHAWYALRNGEVFALNTDAQRSIKQSVVSLTAYQALVHNRYADMLPGSAYDRNHKVGGFNVNPAGPSSSSNETVMWLILGSVASAALLGVGTAAVVRRSRRVVT